MKTRMNITLLLKLLLSEQQLLLFRHQRQRGLSVSKNQELSNSSMDDSSDELGEPGSLPKLEQNFQQLKSF